MSSIYEGGQLAPVEATKALPREIKWKTNMNLHMTRAS
jgi:hypothetical protein